MTFVNDVNVGRMWVRRQIEGGEEFDDLKCLPPFLSLSSCPLLPPPPLPLLPPAAQSSKGGSFKSKSKATPPNPSTSSGPTRSSHRAVKRPRTYDEDLAELEIQMQKVTKKPKGAPKGGVGDFNSMFNFYCFHSAFSAM